MGEDEKRLAKLGAAERARLGASVDALVAEYGRDGSADDLERIARELVTKVDVFDEPPSWSLLLVAELRRRAEVLRRRPQ